MRLVATLITLAALAPIAGDTLAFGPEPGTKLQRRYELNVHLSQESMSVSIGENELPDELTKDTSLDWTSRQTLVVEDEYKEVEDGRPVSLARRYVELDDVSEQNVRMLGMSEAVEEKKEKDSDLEGQTVLFRWNEEDSSYDKEWVGDGADDELLEGLEEDMDFRLLVPSKSLAAGDSWKIDLQEFNLIFGPGGDLSFESDDDDDDDDAEFQKNLSGEVTCTYKGIQEEGGRKLARIAAVCKGKTYQDDEQGEGTAIHTDFDLSLEGEFLWDNAAKHLASFKLAGDITSEMKVTQAVETDNGSAELVIRVGLTGKLDIECEVEAQ